MSSCPVFFSNALELVKEGAKSICSVITEDQLADIDTKSLSKHRHLYLHKVIKGFTSWLRLSSPLNERTTINARMGGVLRYR